MPILKNGKKKILVGDIVELDFNRRRPKPVPSVFSVIEQAMLDYDSNIEIIARLLGETAAMTGKKKPVMNFVGTADPANDHPDGAVHVLRGDPEQPVVVVSENTASFFERNGHEGPQATKTAALYATATGFAV